MENKISIRPIIQTIENSLNCSDIEIFQNKILRPILKLQNDLLWLFFEENIRNKKVKWNELSIHKKYDFISNSMNKDLNFKLSIIHLIVGHFTTEEFNLYKSNAREYKKRLSNMIEQRLKDNAKSQTI